MRKNPTKAYRFHDDKENFEGIEWSVDGNDLVIRWIWAGRGQCYQPVATVHNGRVIVTWVEGIVWPMPTRAEGGANLPVVLAKG